MTTVSVKHDWTYRITACGFALLLIYTLFF